MIGSIRKYLKILRISLVERLTYRADFFVTTFFRFLPLITTFLLWKAIYAGSGKQEIVGFTRKRNDRLSAARADQPDVLEHAGTFDRHRAGHP